MIGSPVMPAEAGIHADWVTPAGAAESAWTPASAGATASEMPS
jgi:hypothetical protein